MIAQIKGEIIDKTDRSLVIDAGGVGYDVACNKDLLLQMKIGDTCRLYTHLNVREDAMDLYGFGSAEDLAFFKLLISVSGIGPKSALNILDTAKPSEIKRAIANNDAGTLQAIQGLGKKTAEKIVMELKDKIDVLASSEGGVDDQAALQAIVSLGYSVAEARQALRSVGKEANSLEGKVKAALKLMAR